MQVYTPPSTKIVYHTYVDFVDRSMSPRPIHLVQYDDSMQLLQVELFLDGSRYAVYDDSEINIRLKKPDRSTVYSPAIGVSPDRHTVYFEVNRQMTSVTGKLFCIVEHCFNGQVAGSSSIPILIDGNPIIASAKIDPIDPIEPNPSDYYTKNEVDQKILYAQTKFSNTNLPNVYITSDDPSEWGDKTDERIVKINYISPTVRFEHYAKMKPQGTSSLQYPKKNFKIKLYLDSALNVKQKVNLKSEWGSQADYTLKADYVDPTHMCNVTGAQLVAKMQDRYGLFPEAPNRGLIDGFPAMIWFNGQQQGIYNVTIPKSDWQFGLDEANPDHIMMCCETQTGSGAFKSLATLDEWTVEVADNESIALDKFNRLVSFVKDSTDEDFKLHASEYLNLQACFNYYIFAYYSTAIDNLGKNMLMVTYDGLVWSPSLYDLDSLWGVLYDGIEDVGAYRMCPGEYECNDNLLWSKIVSNFGQKLCDTFEQIRDILNPNNVIDKQSQYIYGIDKRFYDIDASTWPDNIDKIHGLTQTGKNLNLRDPYVEYMIRSMATTASVFDSHKSFELLEPFVGDGTKFINTGIYPFKNPNRSFTLISKITMPTGDTGNNIVYFNCFYDVSGQQRGLFVRTNGWESGKTLGIIVGPNYWASKVLGYDQDVIVAITKVGTFYTVQIDDDVVLNMQKMDDIASLDQPLVIGGVSDGSGGATNKYPCTVKNFEFYNKAIPKLAIDDIVSGW